VNEDLEKFGELLHLLGLNALWADACWTQRVRDRAGETAQRLWQLNRTRTLRRSSRDRIRL